MASEEVSAPAIGDDLAGDVIVVDDFYGDPEAVRSLALAAEYAHYPGEQAFMGRESVKAFHSLALIDRFASLVAAPIEVDPARWVFGKFRIALEHEPRPTKVHIDKVDWTAVVYLSRDRDARGGLGIFASVDPSLASVPRYTELAAMGYRSVDEFDRRFVMPRTRSDAAWQLLKRVELRYNRLVLFRGGRRFHAALEPFGDRLESGRLSQHFFFMERGQR